MKIWIVILLMGKIINVEGPVDGITARGVTINLVSDCQFILDSDPDKHYLDEFPTVDVKCIESASKPELLTKMQ